MKNTGKLLGVLFLLIAVLSLFFAFNCFGMYSGGYESNETYGGDAYTGIQNAAAQTANNVQFLNQNITTAFGYVFVLSAATFASIGIVKLASKQPSETNAAPRATTDNYSTDENTY